MRLAHGGYPETHALDFPADADGHGFNGLIGRQGFHGK
jgi:hypothetical protein